MLCLVQLTPLFGLPPPITTTNATTSTNLHRESQQIKSHGNPHESQHRRAQMRSNIEIRGSREFIPEDDEHDRGDDAAYSGEKECCKREDGERELTKKYSFAFMLPARFLREAERSQEDA